MYQITHDLSCWHNRIEYQTDFSKSYKRKEDLLDQYTEIPEQKLEKFERHGYSVIEWGGVEVTSDV